MYQNSRFVHSKIKIRAVLFCYLDAFTNLLDSKSNLDHAYGNATDRFPALLGCILRYKCTRGTRVGLRGAQFGNASHMKQTDDPRFKIGSFFWFKKEVFSRVYYAFVCGENVHRFWSNLQRVGKLVRSTLCRWIVKNNFAFYNGLQLKWKSEPLLHSSAFFSISIYFLVKKSS